MKKFRKKTKPLKTEKKLMRNLKKIKKILCAMLFAAILTASLSSCRTQAKLDPDGINLDGIYFPVFPPPVQNGEEVFFFVDKIKIEEIEYTDVFIVPKWYMLQLALYGSENEAAIAELIARCRP